jgi:hypothetical protein
MQLLEEILTYRYKTGDAMPTGWLRFGPEGYSAKEGAIIYFDYQDKTYTVDLIGEKYNPKIYLSTSQLSEASITHFQKLFGLTNYSWPNGIVSLQMANFKKEPGFSHGNLPMNLTLIEDPELGYEFVVVFYYQMDYLRVPPESYIHGIWRVNTKQNTYEKV